MADEDTAPGRSEQVADSQQSARPARADSSSALSAPDNPAHNTPTRGLPMTGADLIEAERKRQIEREGWSLEHDREHGARRLVAAARAYETENPQRWPFEPESYKPKGALRNLVRAGALFWAAADVDGDWPVPSQGTARCAEKIDRLIAEVRAALDG